MVLFITLKINFLKARTIIYQIEKLIGLYYILLKLKKNHPKQEALSRKLHLIAKQNEPMCQ